MIALLQATEPALADTAVSLVQGNFIYLIIGIALIIGAIAVLSYIKDLIINSVLGLVGWLIISYVLPVFGITIQLPFWASLIVSAIFGLAGLGVMLVLAFLGIL